MALCPSTLDRNISASFFIITLFFVSCKQQEPVPTDSGRVLAIVGDQSLYDKDIRHLIHPNTKNQDSVSLATAFIDQWLRDQLMTREAAKYFSSDDEIDRLVEDYQAKLLKFNLEEKILNERYDTLVSDDELVAFYEQMKEQFILKENLFRCMYVKIEKGTQGLKDFNSNWKKDDLGSIRSFAGAFASESHIDTTQWKPWTELDGWYSKWSTSRVKQKIKQRQIDSEYEYFLKIVDSVDKGAFSPLEYIRPQLYRMFLHKRKQEIIEDYKQELYEKALNNNILKIS